MPEEKDDKPNYGGASGAQRIPAVLPVAQPELPPTVVVPVITPPEPLKEHPFHRHAAAGDVAPDAEHIAKKKGAKKTSDSVSAKVTSKSHPFSKSSKITKIRNGLFLAAAGALVIGGLFWYFVSIGRGSIFVADGSPDLTVTVNGRSTTPERKRGGYSLPLFAGQYRVIIEKPHYAPFNQTVQVNLGKTTTIRPAFTFQPDSKNSDVSTVAFVRPSADQRTIFYVGNNGTMPYRMDVTNQDRVPLALQPLRDIRDVQWSTEPTVALITRSDGIYLREIPSYDFRNQTLIKIGGTDIISPVWDPLNPNRMAFVYQPPTGERSLVFTDKRLTVLDRKADTSALISPKVAWSPTDEHVLLVSRSANVIGNNLWVYTTKNGSLKQITSGGSVTDASFSPDGKHILYQTGDSDLHTVNPDGSQDTALSIKGSVTRSAWKDASTIILPGSDNSLTLFYLNGKQESIAFTFPSPLDIQALYYFPKTNILIFNTAATIYTVDLTR